ncbi:MAG: NUDIX domain-containing protein [Thermoplasmata archaeon]
MYYLDCKCLLKKDGTFLISQGRAKLLRLIDETGSISDSARELSMSYRHAWGTVKKIEDAAGFQVIKTHRGGSDKGGSVLTEEGRTLLEIYDKLKNEHVGKVYRRPALTVDGILVEEDKLLLIVRKADPYKGKYALPGGFVEYGETVEKAVVREMKEETGLDCRVKELLGVYSDPERDPRGHTISTVFTLKRVGGELTASSDAEDVGYFTLAELPKLAFDHGKIVQDYLNSSL